MFASKLQIKTFSTDIMFNGCNSVVAGSNTGMHPAGDGGPVPGVRSTSCSISCFLATCDDCSLETERLQ